MNPNRAFAASETLRPSRVVARGHILVWICGSVVLLLLIAAIVGGGAAFYLWRSEPSYWQAHQQFRSRTTPQERQNMADQLVNRIARTISDPEEALEPWQLADAGREGSSPAPPAVAVQADGATPVNHVDSPLAPRHRRLTATFDEINAWLDERSAAYLAHQGKSLPASVSGLMLTAQGQNLVLAFQLDTDEIQQVVSVVFEPRLLPDGRMQVQIASIRGGRLPMPTDKLLEQIQQELGDDSSAEADLLAKILEGQPFEPVWPVDGSRQGRLTGLAISPEGVDLRFRVEPRQEP
ncbi:MAG TPA: hypothetical protein VF184_02110 [Phycisphaeraceae bacterium]